MSIPAADSRTFQLASLVGVNAFQGAKVTVAGEAPEAQGNTIPPLHPTASSGAGAAASRSALAARSCGRRSLRRLGSAPPAEGLGTKRLVGPPGFAERLAPVPSGRAGYSAELAAAAAKACSDESIFTGEGRIRDAGAGGISLPWWRSWPLFRPTDPPGCRTWCTCVTRRPVASWHHGVPWAT